MKNKHLKQMSYEEFGKLRFLAHFKKTDKYDVQPGIECGIGIGIADGYPFTMFISPFKKKGLTCEISLDFDHDCPEDEGHSFLDSLGLNIRKGMSRKQVKEILDRPVEEELRCLDYVIGKKWQYCVGLLFSRGKMCRVWICRKDLADRNREF